MGPSARHACPSRRLPDGALQANGCSHGLQYSGWSSHPLTALELDGTRSVSNIHVSHSMDVTTIMLKQAPAVLLESTYMEDKITVLDYLHSELIYVDKRRVPEV